MKFLALLSVSCVLLAGCLGSAPQAPTHWTINPSTTAVSRAAAPKYGIVRLAQVNVRPPYDGTKLAVLRPDGSLAFDAFNGFAAAPAPVLRGVAQDVIDASGLFERSIHPTSAAAAPYSLEVVVTRLALDCGAEGRRLAVADLSVLLLKGREIVGTAKGSGSSATADGDYTEAFSKACTSALAEALRGL